MEIRTAPKGQAIYGYQEQIFDDRLDVVKDTVTIHGAIKDDITSDFVYAKLTEQEKNFVMEMTQIAYYSKDIITKVKRHLKNKLQRS